MSCSISRRRSCVSWFVRRLGMLLLLGMCMKHRIPGAVDEHLSGFCSG